MAVVKHAVIFVQIPLFIVIVLVHKYDADNNDNYSDNV